MTTKKSNSSNRDKLKPSFKSSKILKDIYDAKYDLSQLRILTVDGVLPFLDSDESRLLFFHNIPSVAINNEEEQQSLNVCSIELRMSTETLQLIYDILSYELQRVENNQEQNKKNEMKVKNHEHFMFG